MKIEVLGRFIKPKESKKLSDEDKAERDAKRIINPDYEEEDEEVKFEYEPLTFTLEPSMDFLRLDNIHTEVLKANGGFYILKIPYDHFKSLYCELTGIKIKKIVYTD